jgi:hypothetical protein
MVEDIDKLGSADINAIQEIDYNPELPKQADIIESV